MNLSKQAIIFKLMKHSQLTHCWGIYRECCPCQKGRNSIFLPQQPRSTPVRLHSLVPPVLAPGHQVGLLMFPRRLSGSTPSSFSWLLRRRVRSVKQRLHQSYPTVRSKPRSFNEQNCSVSFYKFGSNDLPARSGYLFSKRPVWLMRRRQQPDVHPSLRTRHICGLWRSWSLL